MPAQKKSTAQRVLAITEENKWQPEFREALSLIRACQEAYVLGPHILAYVPDADYVPENHIADQW